MNDREPIRNGKHEEGFRFIERAISNEYVRVQKDNSIQSVATPFSLVDEILERIGDLEGKDVLIIANYDVAKYIAWLRVFFFAKRNSQRFNYKSLTLLTDVEVEGKHFDVVVDNLNEVDKIDMMGKKFDVVIGNPPYNGDSSESKSTNSKDLYKEFYDLSMEVLEDTGTVCLVIPFEWASNRSAFKKKVFNSGKLTDLIVHTKKVFAAGSKKVAKTTCIIKLDNSKNSNTVTFSNNEGVTNTVELTGDSILDLKNAKCISAPEKSLADRWTRGKVSITDIQSEELVDGGKYDVVTALVGADKPSQVLRSDVEATGLGTWKVAMANVGGSTGLGVLKILSPEVAHNYSIVSLPVDSEEDAVKLKSYLESDAVKAVIEVVKASTPNSKSVFNSIADIL